MKTTKNIKFTLIALLFILSGVAGLIYQVVWFKHLSYFLGNTTYSQSIVLSTFMGGLAIGAWWWGKKADGSKNALKLFAWLEIGIAVYCFLYMPIFEGVKAVFISLVKSQGWASDSGIVLSLKFIVSALTMLIPTILMGGTLPVLVRYLSDRISEVGKNVSILYFINSLGAVIGTVLAGFYLLQTIGLRATVYTGATLDLFVGVVFLVIIYASKQQKGTTEKVPQEKSPREKIDFSLTPKQYKIVLWVAAISGFCAMAYEVIWLRLLIPILSSTTYSFTIILTVFITGITLGSVLVYFILPKLKRPYLFLGMCQFGIVISILLTLPFYEKIPYLIWSAFGEGSRADGAYTSYLMLQFYYVFLVMILPTIFMGMSLPIASRIAVTQVKESGRKVGGVFALNTIGTVFGSLLTGLVLIPFVGIKNAVDIILIINTLLFLIIILSSKKRSLIGGFVLLLALTVFGVNYFSNVDKERWGYAIMTSEIARKINREDAPKSFKQFIKIQSNHEDILFYKEGVSGTIVVGKQDDEVYLYTNGKGDANSKTDLPTQTSLGQTPIILHPKPDSVFIIGLGAGTTTGNVLTHGEVQYAEVAEISSEVIEASKYFNHVNQKPLEDERLKVIRDDGISALRLSPYKYDVIISQPSNPWSAGVGYLFTKEFFRDCKKKLKSGGYMAQWFSLYEMDDRSLSLIIETAYSEFEHISFWQIGKHDILFLCSETPFEFDLTKIESSYNQVKPILNEIKLSSFPVFLSQQTTSSKIKPEIKEDFYDFKKLNTENLPLLEHWVPKAYFFNNKPNFFSSFDERSNFSSSKLLLRVYEENKGGFSTNELFELGVFQTISGNREFGYELANKNPFVYLAWAKRDLSKNQFNEALKNLDKAIEASDTIVDFFELRAEVYSQIGENKNNINDLKKCIQLQPDNIDYYNSIMLTLGKIKEFDKVIAISKLAENTVLNIKSPILF